MTVKKLSITNFKSHTAQVFDFSEQINCFVGNNGSGKTNILDALHYLSVGKSFLGNTGLGDIKNGEDFFTLEAFVSDDTEDSIRIIQPKDAKKTIKKNDKNYERIADHIGFLPSVMISPYDQNLITDSGEGRRKFLDAMISQTDHGYLHHLVQYQKALQQRNALLKFFAKNNTYDGASLEIYDEPLVVFGAKIFSLRETFIQGLLPLVKHFYEVISDGKEIINIAYESDVFSPKESAEERFRAILKENLSRDRALTYTSRGTHKDDLVFEMNAHPLKKIGSQGQQKSFLIALKLAQMQRIKEITKKTPILLLDDIFDKLDDLRVAQLINLVNRESFGQIFITDTHRERTENVVKRINEESKIFEII